MQQDLRRRLVTRARGRGNQSGMQRANERIMTGMQQRYVQCVRKSDMAPVSSDLCDSAYMPSTVQQCGQDPCPPEWSTGHWSPCSESCEKGTQERQVLLTHSRILKTKCCEGSGRSGRQRN